MIIIYIVLYSIVLSLIVRLSYYFFIINRQKRQKVFKLVAQKGFFCAEEGLTSPMQEFLYLKFSSYSDLRGREL